MIKYKDHLDATLESMTPTERAEHDLAYAASGLAGSFAQVTYDARFRAGLTHAGLAERIGETAEFVDLIEESGVVPTIELLDRIARACGERLTFTFTAA
jgi:ribosome-binding protein aMBF1 (putative translation factor)